MRPRPVLRIAARLRALGLALLLCGGATATPLDADLARLLTEERIAGLVYATVDGEITTVGAVGQADARLGSAMRPEHRVLVGSVAKVVIALGVLRLVTQGQLDLDAPLDGVLPALAVDNPWRDTHPLRVRHLIDMTSGLDDIRLRHFFSTRITAEQPLAAALADDPALLRLRTAPGRVFSYSNTGFHIAAMVIEAVSGERYEDYITREVLRPIGMHASSLSFPDPHRDQPLATGHLDDGAPVAPIPVALRPAAQFSTTAADMATLARFLLRSGDAADPDVIRADLRAAMGRALHTDAARAGLEAGYALGLFTRDRHGAVGRCHGGSIAGWRALFCLFPQTQRAFFVGYNSDNEDADYDRFEARLMRSLGLAAAAPAVPPHAAPPQERRWSGRYVPSPSRLSVTTLVDHLAAFWVLDLDTTPATLTPALGRARALEPLGAGRYRQEDRLGATYVLIEGEDGSRIVSSSYLRLRRIGTAEFAALWTATLAGVAALGYFLLAPVWRRRRERHAWREPGFVAALALGASCAALAMQPWQRLGDLTPASAGLALASLFLPVSAVWELARQPGRRRAGLAWRTRTLAGLALLVFVGLLHAFGLWPLALWRL